MGIKRTRPQRPTNEQAQTLRRLANTGGLLILIHTKRGDSYSDLEGSPVPLRIAKALIENGWVIEQKDSLFDLSPQSWRVRNPADGR